MGLRMTLIGYSAVVSKVDGGNRWDSLDRRIVRVGLRTGYEGSLVVSYPRYLFPGIYMNGVIIFFRTTVLCNNQAQWQLI